MRVHGVWVAGFGVVVAAGLSGQRASGQSNCFTGSGLLNNICQTGTTDTDYVTNGTYQIASVNVVGVSYVLNIHYNSLDVWDASNPFSPRRLTTTTVGLPWTTTGEGTHYGLTPHLRGMATLDGFPYAIASLYYSGWDFFKVTEGRFLKTGYNPGASLKSNYYLSSALFWRGREVYAAGQMLDAASLSPWDYSVYLYLVQNQAKTITPESLTYQTMSQHRARVPIGQAGDPSPYDGFGISGGGTLRFYTFTIGGSPRLLVSNGTQAVVVDVSGSTLMGLPVPVAMWTRAGNGQLFSGPWAMDRDHGILHVADSKSENVYSYDLLDPTAPKLLPPTTWHTPLYVGQPRPVTLIAAGSTLIAVGCGSYMGYIPIGTDGKPAAPLASNDTDPSQATYINPNQCVHPTLQPGVTALSVFSTATQTCAARAIYSWGDVITVAGTCLSTAPAPAFTVTGGSAGANCAGAPTGLSAVVAAQGFPGDTLGITDNSRGAMASGTLDVYTPANPPPAAPLQSWTWTGPNAWTPSLQWVSPPAQAPGEYWLTMTLFDDSQKPYALTQSIFLCGDPQAGISVNPLNYLTGDTVTFSAGTPASQGTPSGYNWLIAPPTGLPMAGTGPQYPLRLDQQGGYNVYVRVHYAHQASSDSRCAQEPFLSDTTNLPPGSRYDSCVTLAVQSLPFSVGLVTASQGSNTSGPYLIGQPINLASTYKLGATYTATFTWKLDDLNNPVATYTATPTPPTDTAGASKSGSVTGTIPASTLTAGQHTIYLVASATNGTPVNPTPPQATFQVVNCVPPGQISAPTPASGSSVTAGSVTFSWSAPAGTPPITYTVGIQFGGTVLGFSGCSNLTTTTCTTNLSANTYPWYIKATNNCSPTGGVLSGPFTLTVNPSAPPPPPPTYPPYANFSFSPTFPQTDQQIQFTDGSSNMSAGFAPLSWSWDFGDGTSSGGITVGGHTSSLQNPTFSFPNAKTYTVTLTVRNTYSTSSTTRQVTVSAPCLAATAPTASFSPPLNPRVGQSVPFTDTSTGGPTSWSWDFGDGTPPLLPDGSSSAQNPNYTFKVKAQIPYTVTVSLTATNCKGSSTTSQQVTVLSACSETVVPTPDFTWDPTGTLASFPEQTQPYAGQPVTLTDASSNNPTSWNWYDFEEGAINLTVRTPTFPFTWNLPGDKHVRMTATNCVGISAEKLKIVHVYDDVRHVTADFSWSPADVSTTGPVTFTAAQGYANGNPTDFSWSFDDGTTLTGASVTHTYKCSGTHRVTLTSTRHNASGASYSATVIKGFTASGTTCGPESVMAVDAAKVLGLNNTNWHADLRIFNASKSATNIWLEFLPAATDNVQPFKVGPYQPPLPPKGTLVLDDILQWAADNFKENFTKAALRITYKNDDNVAPIVLVRTYNLLPDGSRYGQMNPGIEVVPGTTQSPLWLTGLRNNGLDTGFRTNYSLVNLRGDTSCASCITFTMFDEAGAAVGTKSMGLWAFGYIQDSIKNLFGASFANIGTFSLKIDFPAGQDIQAYASVMDNLTGDPVMITASTVPDSPIYLVAMAHNSGVGNTVWRTDLQLTNPDTNAAHSWEVKYLPKAQDGLPMVVRAVTLAPNKSLFVNDAVEWVFSGLLPADAETSGVIRIAPTDGMGIYPMVAARSFNLTPTGTFGQGIPALWAARGVSATSDNKRLLLTGMSSEDIARTNLGFINLSETDGVDIAVYFYDESGTLLNPLNTDGTPAPYIYGNGPGTWDQDKLENRFNRAFKSFAKTLPTNLRSISAEVVVRGGGPALVYASVIDSQTGDPNFIAAQPAP